MHIGILDNMKKVEALAVDIDGTITDSKRRICISALNAIRKAEENNIPTIIVTGNIINYAYATSVLIGTSGGVISENGGVIYKEGTNNNEIQILSNKKYVNKAGKYLKDHIDSKYELKITSDDKYREPEIVYYKTLPKYVIIEILKNFKYFDKIRIYDSDFAIHITDKSVNKGSSLKLLCKQNNINISNVMAIGDSENDEEFLKVAGLKIAVKNAEKRLKEISDYVCENSYGDGVKEAIYKFVL